MRQQLAHGEKLTREGTQLRQARLALEQALVLDPTNLTARFRIAQIHLMNKKWDMTEMMLRQAMETAPDEAALHEMMGDAMLGKGDDRAALTHFQARRTLRRIPSRGVVVGVASS